MVSSHQTAAKIVVVTEGGPHIWAIVNTLCERLGPVEVILEAPESKKRLLLRRARRQGFVSAAGQFATMALTRLGKRFFAGHAARLIGEEDLKTEPAPGQAITRVPSANSPECLARIAAIEPSVVLLAGCRMLSARTLSDISCPVLNYHAGITPKYRGMNGGYWALACGDRENFGTTVHLVDAGVDTGAPLRQVRGAPKRGDTIASYALRQAAFSRNICVEAVADALAGKFATFDPGLPSRQWFHPTIWSYVRVGVRRGVW